MKTQFVHLHLHTQYSLLDGAIRLSDLFKRAKEYKMSAIAMTDHGNMYGAIDFYKQSLAKGIKPIIGCELYVAPSSRFEKQQGAGAARHLTVLAKNEIGYKNLMKLSSLGFLEGYHYRPRVDKELLSKHADGLIALSGCLHGVIAEHLENDNGMEKALETAKEYRNIFGDSNFYLELMENNLQQQKNINMQLIDISNKLDIPLVATNDCHYLDQKDHEAHEVM
ncbi:MAG: PHP domain-containing protein, partial [Deltaproteobacteria bacterium]